MGRTVFYLMLASLGLLSLAGCRTQEYLVKGPEGGIAVEITLPEDFFSVVICMRNKVFYYNKL